MLLSPPHVFKLEVSFHCLNKEEVLLPSFDSLECAAECLSATLYPIFETLFVHTHPHTHTTFCHGEYVAGIFSIFRGVNDNKSMSTSLEKWNKNPLGGDDDDAGGFRDCGWNRRWHRLNEFLHNFLVFDRQSNYNIVGSIPTAALTHADRLPRKRISYAN